MLVEVCAGSLEDCLIAERAGADRIELNSALALGGLTPSAPLVCEAKKRVSIPIVTMVRPRPGNFCYRPEELAQLKRELQLMLDCGADGVVFGITDETGRIDAEKCAELVRSFCQDCESVYHRAIDVSPDWASCLANVVDLGFDRVLTSGLAKTAFEGKACLASMVERFGNALGIVAGSGVHSSNVENIVVETGCREVHGSFSRNLQHFETPVGDFGAVSVADETEVKRTVEICRNLANGNDSC